MAKKPGPRGPLEKQIQREICEYLSYKGIFFWRSNNLPAMGRPDAQGNFRFRALPKFTPRGLPDIMCVINGIFLAIEVKRPGAKLRPEQHDFGVKVIKNDGYYYVVRSLQEVQVIPQFLPRETFGLPAHEVTRISLRNGEV